MRFPFLVRYISFVRRDVSDVFRSMSSYGFPIWRYFDNAPTMRETVERARPVRLESSVTDSPSFNVTSARHIAYCSGNSGSIFCNSLRSPKKPSISFFICTHFVFLALFMLNFR